METLVLDPNDVARDRTPFDITEYVAQAGPDWGEAAIEQYLADVQQGQIPVDFRLPNRTITIPLLLRDDAGVVTFEQLRARFQQKTGLFQREGGWIKRQTKLGSLFADVISAQLKLGGSTAQALWGIDADAVLTLTTLPDWYGEEVISSTVKNVADATDLIYTISGGGDSALFRAAMLFSNPSLYWRLGVNGLDDQTANNRDGTAVGGLVVGGEEGALGQDPDTATAFSALGQSVTSTYSPFVAGTTRTFAGLTARSVDGGQTLWGSSGAAYVSMDFNADSGDVTFSVNGTTAATWAAAWPGREEWVYWALIFNDTANTAELYINGVSQGVKSVTQAYSSPGTFKLGSHGSSTGLIRATMDEIAIWERALIPAEIAAFALQTVGRSVAGELAARARLILTDLSSTDLHGLLWGVRSRFYSDDPTARLSYEADSLTAIAPAAYAANASASTGFEMLINAVATNWTAVVSTDMAGSPGSPLTHVGSYRVWARVRTAATGGKAPKVRLVWDVGDLMRPVENQPVRLPYDTDWYLADLGEVRLDPAPIGVHRWQGVIQAADGFGAFAIDKIWLQPLDEAAGRLSISPVAAVGLTGYSARDEFDQAGGAVTGATLPIGGLWTFSHGDADDFTIDAVNDRAYRVSTLDATPRFIYAATPTLAACAAQVDFYLQVPTPGANPGIQQAFLMFRRVDANNYAYAVVGNYAEGNSLSLYYVVGGNPPALLATVPISPHQAAWWSLRIAVSERGYVFAWLFPRGAVPPADPTVMRYDPTHFGTGQALAQGKLGIGDQNSGATADSRYYDNFLAWIPDIDAVMFAGRSAELRHDGMYREAVSGGSFSTVSTVLGDLLRLPPAGMEDRPVEVFLKPTFGDLDQGADSVLLKLAAQMRYRPSYLFVPEG